jgi:hypothetical protein
MVAIMIASAALSLLSDRLRLTPDRMLLVFGALTLVSSVYVLWLVPEFLIRFSLWLLTHTVYRIRIVGEENVPFRGPALLVSITSRMWTACSSARAFSGSSGSWCSGPTTTTGRCTAS